MGDNPGESDLEAEILSRNDRVKTIAYCNSKGEQIGPHFLEMFPPTTQDGVDYWHGRILDGRAGHYSTKDGSDVYGGPTKEPSEVFEEIDGKSYKRVEEDDERTALKDVRGGRYTGYAHDTIHRPDHPTPLDDQGTVYHVTDDEEEGWYLNEKICGGNENGMNHKSTLFKVGNEKDGYKVYLVAENKEGKKKVVDIETETGEIKFGDEDKCTDVELLMIGNEICAKKTYGKTQEFRAENGDVIYYGFTAMAGEWFDGPGGGPFQRTYDKKPKKAEGDEEKKEGDEEKKEGDEEKKEGDEEKKEYSLLTIVDRRSDGGSCKARFGTDKKPARREGTGSPKGDGIFEIDRKQLVQLFVDNPDPAEKDLLVTFPDSHGTDPFRGPHYKLGKTKDDMPRMETVDGITGILFENKSKEIGYVGSNGNEMFGGHHFDELDTIKNWWYNSEGKRADSPVTLKHFVELSSKHVVLDHKGKPFFPKNADAEKPEGHTSIRNFWVLSYQKDGEDRNVLIAEAADPIGFGRNLNPWNWLKRVGRLITGKGWTPSTYYLQDGTKADSIDTLKQGLEAPNDAQLVYAKDFKDPNAEDMAVTEDTARDTGIIDLKDLKGVAPEVRELYEKAKAASASSGERPAKDGTTSLGAAWFPEEEKPADAYVGEAPAPAEEAEQAEVGEVAETEPEGDAGTTEEQQESGGDSKSSTGSWLLDGDGEPGADGKETGEQ